jgi:PleD family two-component response regulator
LRTRGIRSGKPGKAEAASPATPMTLVKAADVQVYEAKRAGRDRVTGEP